ncbi:acyl- -binding domain-containing 4 [Olea europaea subsp. europaea]|uniref:Acyl- -binding domain-containing 4 n=1 Tax=Olea europaea subsp. europaea TaxID=158383 RepID=A0A8S0UT22_OLEEU|nr:acyl- -binding domain-containing 4 [Olea europaea subsp. europaea]
MMLSFSGDKPTPRFNHAAAVVGNKMEVVGGESGDGLLDDVQVLRFDKFSWTTASSKLYLSLTNLPLKIPACKGHALVPWEKKILLIGGKTDPVSDKFSRQLEAALASHEASEKNLSSALKSRQEIENKLAAMMKEVELLKEKLVSVGMAQEYSNSLSNIFHSDNVKLEHDVAFLKALFILLIHKRNCIQLERSLLESEKEHSDFRNSIDLKV